MQSSMTPLTATLLIFELTRAYEIVLPLLAAAGVDGERIRDISRMDVSDVDS